MRRDDETRSIDAMIAHAGWFPGSERDWQALSRDVRESMSFASTGCLFAYPTWPPPVECVHTPCQVARGEIRPMVALNRKLRHEMDSGWLRFSTESREGRIRLARTVKALRRAAVKSGIYDPWQLPGGWQALVGSAINP